MQVAQDRAIAFVKAVSRIGLDHPRAIHIAGHATLCSSPEDRAVFDDVVSAWFAGLDDDRRPHQLRAIRDGGMNAERHEGDTDHVLVQRTVVASSIERLRHRDIADLDDDERAAFRTIVEQIVPTLPRRTSRRCRPSRRGVFDARRTLRAELKHHGEPGEIRRQRSTSRPRRLLFLIDISGSMEPYADALLRLAHRYAFATSTVGVYTIGTRVTSITRALRIRDTERALAAMAEIVPDWSGGTRLGEAFGSFLGQAGERNLARGAVVVVLSDGWEQGDCHVLGTQAALMSRLANRVVWVNPQRGKPGYEPVQRGIVAVLPYVDDFVSGHSLAAFLELREVLANA
ncbi:VWA domain-containing protein [Gordonia sp. HNM0687]|uniref:VWA domain-containing protein n=2 Tax=Gordonia mangrovi TaxID=2665643 RepID=A0A6L7GVC7_9ACTN|nr:VWA domain-containing protein [Gordonia mangrovi]